MTDFFVEPVYKSAFEQLGLTSIDAFFAFQGDKNLAKANLAPHRSRIEFQIDTPATTLFLKRYDNPPMSAQFKNWISTKKRISFGFAEFETTSKLLSLGINTPKSVAWGQLRGCFFEKHSFIITEKVPQGESIERRLPDCFNSSVTLENLKLRRQFISRLAEFIKKFHETGFRHRDLYFSHIFLTADSQFYLIDLARAFRPAVFSERYRIKDLAELNYSAPTRYFSNADRLRFYNAYAGESKLKSRDKTLIRKIIRKTRQIARHDIKRRNNGTEGSNHNRAVRYVAGRG
jgi:tRNA A-37 threonylcarbamoyl transferase component Bud32